MLRPAVLMFCRRLLARVGRVIDARVVADVDKAIAAIAAAVPESPQSDDMYAPESEKDVTNGEYTIIGRMLSGVGGGGGGWGGSWGGGGGGGAWATLTTTTSTSTGRDQSSVAPVAVPPQLTVEVEKHLAILARDMLAGWKGVDAAEDATDVEGVVAAGTNAQRPAPFPSSTTLQTLLHNY